MKATLNPLKATFSEQLYRITTNTVVALDTPWHQLSASEITLLSNILKSINCSLHGVQIIEAASIDLASWPKKPAKLIGFGVQIEGSKSYELITMRGTRLVCADTLTVLCSKHDLKKKLWSVLKKAFSK